MLELSLPEALVVLGIEADQGTTRDRLTLSYAIGGGQLAELELAGRISVDDEQVVVINDAATGDEHLDELLAKIAGADRPHTPGHWVMKRRSAGLAVYARRLVATGVVRGESRRLLEDRRRRATRAGRGHRRAGRHRAGGEAGGRRGPGCRPELVS